jgi:RNA polymerase sigma-70 factor (ECF subfamily)
MEEHELVQAAREGDLDAFRELFEMNKTRIFSIAFRYARNKEDAEDILQDTFVKAYQSLDSYKIEGGCGFTSWLYRIGINSSIDLLRKNRKMRNKFFDPDNFDNLPSGNAGDNPENTARLQDARDKIGAALKSLTSRQRMIFILRHYQQLNTREIAEYMGCSQGSVKKQLFRAVSAVKNHFKGLVPEENYEVQNL